VGILGRFFKIIVDEIIALVAFPIAIGIYIKLCNSTIMETGDELANNAIEINEILDEKKRLEIRLHWNLN
jgi:hypothetical protein